MQPGNTESSLLRVQWEILEKKIKSPSSQNGNARQFMTRKIPLTLITFLHHIHFALQVSF